MGKTFRDVIDKDLGGATEANADDLGVSLYALRKWQHRNRIPSDYWLPVVRVAASRGNTISLEELAAIAAGNARAVKAETAA